MRLPVLLTFLQLFSSSPARAQSVHEFSIKQCIDYAFANQSKVLNAQLDELSAKAKVREITGIGLPQVNGSFEVTDFPFGPNGELVAFQFGTKYNATASLSASQLIFDGSYLVGLQTTMVFLDLARRSTERTKIETSVTVAKAYYNVLISEERIKLLNANAERLKKLLDDTKALYENGFAEKIDLDRVTLNYNNVVVEQKKLSQLVSLSYYLLKFQIGMDPGEELKLTDKLTDTDLTAGILNEEKFDYSRRIEYTLLQTQEKLNKLELRKNRFAYLPSVAAFATFASQAYRQTFDVFSTGKDWYGMQLIGGRLTLPIFDGLQRRHRISQSKIVLLKTGNDLKALSRFIDLDLRSSSVALQNSLSSLEVQKQNMKLADEVYRVAKLKYDQGVGSNLEVINAEASLKEAQTNYYNALYEAYVAKVEYSRANGNFKF
jgi:outer membrane protein